MNYQEYLDSQKEISKKNDLEYLKIQEEIKYAISKVERKAKEHNIIKQEKGDNER